MSWSFRHFASQKLVSCLMASRYGKTGSKKPETSWRAIVMLRVLLSTKKKKLCNLICCKAGSNFFGKTRNIALQLVLHQCCKASCTFFVARFCCSLNKWCSEFKYSYLIFWREMRSIFSLQLRGLFRQGLQCKGKEFYCELSRRNLGFGNSWQEHRNITWHQLLRARNSPSSHKR